MTEKPSTGSWVRVHPVVIRVTHWLNAVAIFIMVTSGWQIYNAAPIWDFVIPDAITIGEWLAGAIQWHFAAMWLLAANGLVYLAYGIFGGHFRRRLLPVTPKAVISDVFSALRGRLSHGDLTVYNAAQKAAYIALILAIIVLVLSGLAIWKPVQLQEITALFGGFQGARIAHFLAMALVVLIVAVHVLMVALVPRTFPSMITGWIRSGA